MTTHVFLEFTPFLDLCDLLRIISSLWSRLGKLPSSSPPLYFSTYRFYFTPRTRLLHNTSVVPPSAFLTLWSRSYRREWSTHWNPFTEFERHGDKGTDPLPLLLTRVEVFRQTSYFIQCIHLVNVVKGRVSFMRYSTSVSIRMILQ